MNVASGVDGFTRQLAASGRSVYRQAAYGWDLEVLGRWIGMDPVLGKITSVCLSNFSHRAPCSWPRKTNPAPPCPTIAPIQLDGGSSLPSVWNLGG